MDVDAAYRECQVICQQHARTFAFACRFLPSQRRRAVWAIYAYCRIADDIVDTATDGSVLRQLADWRDELLRAYDGAPRHPVLIAYADALTRFPVPLAPALELLEGLTSDMLPPMYDAWPALRHYCYQVASTVGLLTLPILGTDSNEARDRAIDLGIAMQMTNILRDIGEDARMNRIYLPREDLRRFGYSAMALQQGLIDHAFRDLMRFQIERTRGYYAQAEPGIRWLDRSARLPVLLASALYRQILTRIERNDFDVFSKRAHLTTTAKIGHGLLTMRRLPNLLSEP
jgi:phytoene synthase